MSRALTRFIARLLAGVLLLAQWSVATYACPALASSSTMTMAASADTDAPPMPGCEGMAAALDPDAANLCAEHCKAGQQSHDVPAASVPLPLLTALYTLLPAPEPALPPRPDAATLDARVAASPPLAVLHCVYRF